MKIPVVFLLQLSTICLGQNSFEKEMDKLHFKTQKIRDSLSIEFTKYKEANEKNGEILEGLWTVYDSTFVVDAKSDLQFAKSHTNSLELLQLLNIRMSRQESMDLYQDYEIAFQNFSSELQQSPDGKKMEEKLINFKNSKVGSIAPDFYAIDINEKK